VAALGVTPRLSPTAWLRAAVLAFAAAVLWWPLARGPGVAAAALAAAAAALGADWLALRSRRRVRAAAVLGGALLFALLGLAVAHLAVALEAPSALVGPVAVLTAGAALRAFALTAAAVFCLRMLASRQPVAAVVEVALAAAALALSLAAHREGMVHLPLALGDLAFTRGFDPTLLLLGLGGAGVVLLAALLLAEERARRIPRHLAVAALAALLLAAVVRLAGLPQPQAPEDLGLTGAQGESQPQPREQPGRGSENELGELVFRNEYRSDGGRAPVAVVVFHDDYSPPTGVYYFRQSAFSLFNGRRLVQASGDGVDRDVIASFPPGRYEVPAAPPDSEQRAPVRATTGLLVDHVRPFALDAAVLFEPRPNAAQMRFQRVFDTLSLASDVPYPKLLGSAPGSAGWSGAEWEHYTAGPSDPRYAELARSLLPGLADAWRDDPLARALAVKRHLDENGIYSLKSHHADAEDPVASFLFGDRTGYCVHFAHAAVYLLRALGVPSRVAAGYAVAEADLGGSSLLIRGLDAHAWPEIFLDGLGWVVVDLSPERVLDAIAERPDPALGSMLGELLRGAPADEAFAAERWRGWPGLAQVARVLAGLALAAAALAALVKLGRRVAPRLANADALPRLAYRCALDQLADAGALRRFGETRERFAERVGPRAPSFARLTALHLRRAFGGAGRAEPAEVRGLARSVAREVARSTPFWRRALGAANPFSWLFVR
jgi:transglutaminase-like putative cysteine protease